MFIYYHVTVVAILNSHIILTINQQLAKLLLSNLGAAYRIWKLIDDKYHRYNTLADSAANYIWFVTVV